MEPDTKTGSLQARPKIGGNKFDILKIVLSFFILCLHSGIFSLSFRPLFRMAVPLFFIMSSYFFFSKLRYISDAKERGQALAKYLKRIFFLLLFWTILFIVPNTLQREWYVHGFPRALLYALQAFCLNSTFMASWFLSSTIISTAIIYWAIYKARIPDWVTMSISLILYLFCCGTSTYYSLVSPNWATQHILPIYSIIIGQPHLSFITALVWIMIGKMIAYADIKVSWRMLLFLSLTFFIIAHLEYYVIYRTHRIWSDDCFLSLLIACPLIFMLVIRVGDVSISYAKLLRKMSVIIFCSHGTFLWIYRQFIDSPYTVFFLTLLSCVVVGMVIIHLSDKFRILRYSH